MDKEEQRKEKDEEIRLGVGKRMREVTLGDKLAIQSRKKREQEHDDLLKEWGI